MKTASGLLRALVPDRLASSRTHSHATIHAVERLRLTHRERRVKVRPICRLAPRCPTGCSARVLRGVRRPGNVVLLRGGASFFLSQVWGDLNDKAERVARRVGVNPK